MSLPCVDHCGMTGTLHPKHLNNTGKERRSTMNYLKKHRRFEIMICIVMLFALAFSTTAFATGTGDVAGAIESTWSDASAQIKTVVNKVVFPAIDLVLAVFFFAKLAMAYFDYRKQGQFEWVAPAILFVCLVFSLTAPLYIWTILGI